MRYRLHTYSRTTGMIVGISTRISLRTAERLAGGARGLHRGSVDIIRPA